MVPFLGAGQGRVCNLATHHLLDPRGSNVSTIESALKRGGERVATPAQDKAYRVNDLLKDYVAVHDDIYGWRGRRL